MSDFTTCAVCGADVTSSAAACWSCGASRGAQGSESSEPVPPPPPTASTPVGSGHEIAPPVSGTLDVGSGSHTGRNLTIGVGALAVAVFVGAVALSSPGEPSAAPPPSSGTTTSSLQPTAPPAEPDSDEPWTQVKSEFAEYSEALPGHGPDPYPEANSKALDP